MDESFIGFKNGLRRRFQQRPLMDHPENPLSGNPQLLGNLSHTQMLHLVKMPDLLHDPQIHTPSPWVIIDQGYDRTAPPTMSILSFITPSLYPSATKVLWLSLRRMISSFITSIRCSGIKRISLRKGFERRILSFITSLEETTPSLLL